MFEKDMYVADLLDCYGAWLSDYKRNLIELYYNEDYSLSEIAENSGLTRQGVRDSVKKSETELREMEQKLHFAEKTASVNAALAALTSDLEALNGDGRLSAVIDRLHTISL